MENRLCLYSYPYDTIDSYYKMIDLAAELGLKGVEGFSDLEFASPDFETAKRIRDYADRKGICFPCLSVFANLVGDRAEMFERQLMGYVEVCAILGSPYLHHTIAPYCRNPESVLSRKEEYFNKGIEAVRRLADFGASVGVQLVFEDQGYIFNGCEGFGRFMKEVGRDVGVVADLGNIYQVDERPEAFIDCFGPSIRHAHIKDALYRDHCPEEKAWIPTAGGGGFLCCNPGEGSVDFKSCFASLKKAGYQGWYGLEFSVGDSGIKALAQYIEQLNSWMEE